ncbi:MAG: DM13 domain-containing protein [Leptolyngbyaceae cyanobacterium]
MLNLRFATGMMTLAAVLFTTACTPAEPEATVGSQPETTEDIQSTSLEESTAPEANTVPEPAESTSPDTTTASAVSKSGTFASGEHATQGAAMLISQDGTQTLTFDDAFSTSDGPDLVVVLHRSAAVLEETTPPAYPLVEADYVIIAPLASTSGAQQYTISADVNIDEYQSVAIWCQAFNATFGAAALE